MFGIHEDKLATNKPIVHLYLCMFGIHEDKLATNNTFLWLNYGFSLELN